MLELAIWLYHIGAPDLTVRIATDVATVIFLLWGMDRKEDCAKITAVYDGKGTEIEMEGTPPVLLVIAGTIAANVLVTTANGNMKRLAATKRVMHEMIDSFVNEELERQSKENREQHAPNEDDPIGRAIAEMVMRHFGKI